MFQRGPQSFSNTYLQNSLACKPHSHSLFSSLKDWMVHFSLRDKITAETKHKKLSRTCHDMACRSWFWCSKVFIVLCKKTVVDLGIFALQFTARLGHNTKDKETIHSSFCMLVSTISPKWFTFNDQVTKFYQLDNKKKLQIFLEKL